MFIESFVIRSRIDAGRLCLPLILGLFAAAAVSGCEGGAVQPEELEDGVATDAPQTDTTIGVDVADSGTLEDATSSLDGTTGGDDVHAADVTDGSGTALDAASSDGASPLTDSATSAGDGSSANDDGSSVDSTDATTPNADATGTDPDAGGGDAGGPPNNAPTGGKAAVDPDPAFASDELQCKASSANDADGDKVTWKFAWTVNAKTVSGQNTDKLAGKHFVKGDKVACVATPGDGKDDGKPVTSAAVTIANSVPTLAKAEITIGGGKGTCATYVCTATGLTDADTNDKPTIAYQWQLDGAAIGNSATLQSDKLKPGASLTCTATPSDGEKDAKGAAIVGKPVKSLAHVIKDAPPTIAGAAVKPAKPVLGQTLTCEVSGLADAECPTKTSVTYAWFVDGKKVAGAKDKTLASKALQVGAMVACEATPTDQHGPGKAVTASAVTLLKPIVGKPIANVSLQGGVPTCAALNADKDASLLFSWRINGGKPFSGVAKLSAPVSGCELLECKVTAKVTGASSDSEWAGLTIAQGNACKDGGPCKVGSCAKTGGCAWTDKTGACDDGNACTTKDSCAAGACGGAKTVCDDNDPCTADSCLPSKGCATKALSGVACNDGDACTAKDACAAGKCTGQKVCNCAKTSDCNDGNACTVDACVAQKCTYTNSTAPCDDGNICTTGDACKGGVCTPAATAKPTTWFQDKDGDGHGTKVSIQRCGADKANAFTAAKSGDCNDADKAIHPGAAEICDGVDNNCDTKTDDGDACKVIGGGGPGAAVTDVKVTNKKTNADGTATGDATAKVDVGAFGKQPMKGTITWDKDGKVKAAVFTAKVSKDLGKTVIKDATVTVTTTVKDGKSTTVTTLKGKVTIDGNDTDVDATVEGDVIKAKAKSAKLAGTKAADAKLSIDSKTGAVTIQTANVAISYIQNVYAFELKGTIADGKDRALTLTRKGDFKALEGIRDAVKASVAGKRWREAGAWSTELTTTIGDHTAESVDKKTTAKLKKLVVVATRAQTKDAKWTIAAKADLDRGKAGQLAMSGKMEIAPKGVKVGDKLCLASATGASLGADGPKTGPGDAPKPVSVAACMWRMETDPKLKQVADEVSNAIGTKATFLLGELTNGKVEKDDVVTTLTVTLRGPSDAAPLCLSGTTNEPFPGLDNKNTKLGVKSCWSTKDKQWTTTFSVTASIDPVGDVDLTGAIEDVGYADKTQARDRRICFKGQSEQKLPHTNNTFAVQTCLATDLGSADTTFSAKMPLPLIKSGDLEGEYVAANGLICMTQTTSIDVSGLTGKKVQPAVERSVCYDSNDNYAASKQSLAFKVAMPLLGEVGLEGVPSFKENSVALEEVCFTASVTTDTGKLFSVVDAPKIVSVVYGSVESCWQPGDGWTIPKWTIDTRWSFPGVPPVWLRGTAELDPKLTGGGECKIEQWDKLQCALTAGDVTFIKGTADSTKKVTKKRKEEIERLDKWSARECVKWADTKTASWVADQSGGLLSKKVKVSEADENNYRTKKLAECKKGFLIKETVEKTYEETVKVPGKPDKKVMTWPKPMAGTEWFNEACWVTAAEARKDAAGCTAWHLKNAGKKGGKPTFHTAIRLDLGLKSAPFCQVDGKSCVYSPDCDEEKQNVEACDQQWAALSNVSELPAGIKGIAAQNFSGALHLVKGKQPELKIEGAGELATKENAKAFPLICTDMPCKAKSTSILSLTQVGLGFSFETAINDEGKREFDWSVKASTAVKMLFPAMLEAPNIKTPTVKVDLLGEVEFSKTGFSLTGTVMPDAESCFDPGEWGVCEFPQIALLDAIVGKNNVLLSTKGAIAAIEATWPTKANKSGDDRKYFTASLQTGATLALFNTAKISTAAKLEFGMSRKGGSKKLGLSFGAGLQNFSLDVGGTKLEIGGNVAGDKHPVVFLASSTTLTDWEMDVDGDLTNGLEAKYSMEPGVRLIGNASIAAFLPKFAKEWGSLAVEVAVGMESIKKFVVTAAIKTTWKIIKPEYKIPTLASAGMDEVNVEIAYTHPKTKIAFGGIASFTTVDRSGGKHDLTGEMNFIYDAVAQSAGGDASIAGFWVEPFWIPNVGIMTPGFKLLLNVLSGAPTSIGFSGQMLLHKEKINTPWPKMTANKFGNPVGVNKDGSLMDKLPPSVFTIGGAFYYDATPSASGLCLLDACIPMSPVMFRADLQNVSVQELVQVTNFLSKAAKTTVETFVQKKSDRDGLIKSFRLGEELKVPGLKGLDITNDQLMLYFSTHDLDLFNTRFTAGMAANAEVTLWNTTVKPKKELSKFKMGGHLDKEGMALTARTPPVQFIKGIDIVGDPYRKFANLYAEKSRIESTSARADWASWKTLEARIVPGDFKKVPVQTVAQGTVGASSWLLRVGPLAARCGDTSKDDAGKPKCPADRARIGLEITTAAGKRTVETTYGILPEKAWNHVAATVAKDGKIRLLVNGQAIATIDDTAFPKAGTKAGPKLLPTLTGKATVAAPRRPRASRSRCPGSRIRSSSTARTPSRAAARRLTSRSTEASRRQAHASGRRWRRFPSSAETVAPRSPGSQHRSPSGRRHQAASCGGPGRARSVHRARREAGRACAGIGQRRSRGGQSPETCASPRYERARRPLRYPHRDTGRRPRVPLRCSRRL